MANYALTRTPDGHQWLERREPHFKIETGEPVVHHRCVLCGRDIVTVLSSCRRHAVHVSAIFFYRLDDEVTERWLYEPCPGKRQPKDDEDRNRQIAKILARDGRLRPKPPNGVDPPMKARSQGQ